MRIRLPPGVGAHDTISTPVREQRTSVPAIGDRDPLVAVITKLRQQPNRHARNLMEITFVGIIATWLGDHTQVRLHVNCSGTAIAIEASIERRRTFSPGWLISVANTGGVAAHRRRDRRL